MLSASNIENLYYVLFWKDKLFHMCTYIDYFLLFVKIKIYLTCNVWIFSHGNKKIYVDFISLTFYTYLLWTNVYRNTYKKNIYVSCVCVGGGGIVKHINLIKTVRLFLHPTWFIWSILIDQSPYCEIGYISHH